MAEPTSKCLQALKREFGDEYNLLDIDCLIAALNELDPTIVGNLLSALDALSALFDIFELMSAEMKAYYQLALGLMDNELQKALTNLKDVEEHLDELRKWYGGHTDCDIVAYIGENIYSNMDRLKTWVGKSVGGENRVDMAVGILSGEIGTGTMLSAAYAKPWVKGYIEGAQQYISNTMPGADTIEKIKDAFDMLDKCFSEAGILKEDYTGSKVGSALSAGSIPTVIKAI